MGLGSYIRKQILDKGYRINFVAEACGKSPITFSHYLNDKQPIPESVLKLLVLQFAIDTDTPESDREVG